MVSKKTDAPQWIEETRKSIIMRFPSATVGPAHAVIHSDNVGDNALNWGIACIDVIMLYRFARRTGQPLIDGATWAHPNGQNVEYRHIQQFIEDDKGHTDRCLIVTREFLISIRKIPPYDRSAH